MYKQCVRKNAILQAEVSKLREELDVWKIGFNSKSGLMRSSQDFILSNTCLAAKEKEDAEAKAAKLDQTLTAIHVCTVFARRYYDVRARLTITCRRIIRSSYA